MLMRFDPFRELDRLTQEVWGNGRRHLPMDAYRRGDALVLHLDAPGVEPESIDVTVENDVVTVKAERSWQPTDDDQVLANERLQGCFTRQLFLGEGLDTDHIEAQYNNGVLTLTVPVSERAKPRKVQISNGGETRAIEASATAA